MKFFFITSGPDQIKLYGYTSKEINPNMKMLACHRRLLFKERIYFQGEQILTFESSSV